MPTEQLWDRLAAPWRRLYDSWRHPSRLQLGLLACVCIGLGALPLIGHREVDGRNIAWTSVLPPALALAGVLLSRNVFFSLTLGVVAGTALQHGVVTAIPRTAVDYYWAHVDSWHLHICGFALSVLGMVCVTEASGGAHGVVLAFRRVLRSARSTKLGTAGLGLAVFFDDYANTFLVGPSMRPLADRFGVSREKLAYIVDSTAAPVAGIAVVSTWLSYEIGLLQDVTTALGVTQSGYALLLQALPLRFYCLFSLVLVVLSAAWDRDMGSMLRAERAARQRVRLDAKEAPTALASSSAAANDERLPRWLWVNSAVPVLGLLAMVAMGFVTAGGGLGPNGLDPFSLSSWQRIVGQVDGSERVLLYSAISSVLLAIGSARLSGQLTLGQALVAFGRGVRTGLLPLTILFSAWALGAVCKDLQTGPFLVAVLKDSLPPMLIPLVTFVAAGLVAFSTGTSWGTMAIIVPAAVPLSYHMGSTALMIPTIAAVLDGAIFGDHCSPVSDTTLLSSTACQCDPLAHVWTQLPYALLAMGLAAAAYALTVVAQLPVLATYGFGFLGLVLALGLLGGDVAARPSA